MKSIILPAVLLAATLTPSAQAAAAPGPSIVGTPKAVFAKATNEGQRSYALSVVIRFNRALPTTDARVVIGPRLAQGQRIGSVYGGATPRRIGTSARHCYTIEVGRPRPVSTPTSGARWRVGVTSAGVIRDTARVTLRAFPRDRPFGRVEARQLGCYQSRSVSASKSIIGKRAVVDVQSTAALQGSLQVLHRVGWVRTSGLN